MAKKKKNKVIMRWIMPLIIIVLCLGLTFLGLIVYASVRKFNGPEKVRIYIPAYSTDEAICDTLTTRLGDSFGGGVYRMWEIFGKGSTMATGSYVIEPGESVKSVVHRLNNGLQTPIKFTFNNVRLLPQLAQKASQKMTFSAEEFLAACDSVLPARGYTAPEQYAAAFFPDTYEFYWTTSAKDMVEKLANTHDAFWNDERRAAAKKLGLTPVQVAVVASIVEEESNLDSDRPVIARLYLNRLAKGMMLQADPTVKFAVGDFSLRRINGNHLDTESPYNTYKYKGLPPGPIRIPERKTLEQVLNAPQNNYLYMCADPDFSGRHRFAADYETHKANAAAYRAVLNRKGIF